MPVEPALVDIKVVPEYLHLNLCGEVLGHVLRHARDVLSSGPLEVVDVLVDLRDLASDLREERVVVAEGLLDLHDLGLHLLHPAYS